MICFYVFAGATATKRSTRAPTNTPAKASTFSNSTTPTPCGGRKPSTTESTTQNEESTTRSKLQMKYATDSILDGVKYP